MYLKKLRNMGRKQHSLLLQSCVKWDVKFREQGMLNDHPRRCFHKITLKNWRMLCYISSVRATLHILRQLSQVRSGQLLQESKSAHWFQLSRQLWAKKSCRKIKDWCFTLSYDLLGKGATLAIQKDKVFHTETGSTTASAFNYKSMLIICSETFPELKLYLFLFFLVFLFFSS